MVYVQNSNRIPKWKKLIFPLLIIICIVISTLFFFNPFKKTAPHIVCNLDEKAYEEKINQRLEQSVTIKDYFFYGDYLNLKSEKYVHGKSDALNQKTVILQNICTGEEHSIILEQFIDRQIDLSKLSSGTYKMILVEDFIRKNINSDLNFDEIDTTTKNNKHNHTTFFKNKSNDLFMKVESIDSPETKIDIVVDTIYDHSDLRSGLDIGVGESSNIAYEQAQSLVESLNSIGYRAKLGRSPKNEKDVYGENGRLKILYDRKTKYYITLGFESNPTTRGVYLENSYLASKIIPNAIMYKVISDNDSLMISKLHNTNEYGVLRNERAQSSNGQWYDGNLYIREAGGMATAAGEFSESSKRNESFALNNRYAVYGLYLNLGAINSADVTFLKENNLMQQFAEGFRLQR